MNIKKEAFKAFEYLNNAIKAETIEKMMRVQLVAEGMEEAIEKMRPEEPSDEELNYSAPEDSIDSFVNMPTASSTVSSQSSSDGMSVEHDPQPVKRRFVAGPARPDDDRPLNRAERRKQKGK